MKKIYKALLFFLFLSLTFSSLNAQLVSGNAFLKGNFVEIGVTPCGSYGTRPAPPSGYHARSPGGGLGFVADPGRDGWSSGSPTFCGDYFLPGSPVEGWGVEVAGTSYINSDVCGISTIPGSVTSYSSAAGTTRAVWQGTVGSGAGSGLRITQTTVVNDGDLFFITSLCICNTSLLPMTNVYYGRNLDPDNDQPISGDYTTRNAIEFQPRTGSTASLVTATGLSPGCFLGLGSNQANARVSVGGFSTVAPISGIYRGFSGGTSRDTTLGHLSTADEAISIGFYWPTIAPGECVSAYFLYLLDRSDLSAGLASLGSPSIASDGDDITATLKDTICGKRLVMLSVIADSMYTWTWSPASVLDRTTGDTVYVNSDTTVTITVRGVSTCDNVTRNITIYRDTSLNILIGARDTLVCSGLPVILSPSIISDTSMLTYTWTPSSGLSSTSILRPVSTAAFTTTYYLSVRNDLCSVRDTVTVSRLSSGTFTQSFCPGTPIVVGSNTYTTSGVYSDTFRGGIVGCDSIMITTILPVDTLNTIRDTSICSGERVNLTTTSTGAGVTYLWSPSTGLSSTSIASPVASPTGTTKYVVRTLLGSCYSYDTVLVTVRGIAPVVRTTITRDPYCKGDTLLFNAYVPDFAPGSSDTSNYTGSSRTFTVPSGVTSITIDVRGAQGGTEGIYTGGLGARMQGTFAVSPGQVLTVVVGGAGFASYNSGSGGGGSGVLFGAIPWIIAGGGGGGTANGSENGGPGLTTTTGGASSGPGGLGGSGGQKGYMPGDCGWAAGGGGFTSNGYGGDGSWDGGPLPGGLGTFGGARGWLSGGAGGINGGCSFAYPNSGPFGCGGGGCGSYGGGGGGGYSGGGGGQYTAAIGSRRGGGGGSYNIGTSAVNTAGFQAGNGKVIITWAEPIISVGTIYTWTPSTGLFPRTDTAITNYIVNSVGTFVVSVNKDGCIGYDTVKIKAPLEVHVTPDTTICAGSPVRLNATVIYDTIPVISAPGSLTLNYTGAVQTWVVPTGVTSLNVDISGAKGGNGTTGTGGNGGRVQTTLTVIPGTTLNIYVGGAGGNLNNIAGYNGGANTPGTLYPSNVGGGGGASDIRIGGIALIDRVVVAGGGGAGGYNGCTENGGVGGGLSGGSASPGCGSATPGGGTAVAGGTPGAYSGYATASAGTLGVGGNGAIGTSGSGGGGGYYGGGGGSWQGGGGGSNYSSGTGSIHTAGYRSGSGQVILSWVPIVSAPMTYVWSPTIGLSSSVVLNPLATTFTSVDYIITATAGICVVRDTARLIISPGDSIYQTQTICFGSSVLVGSSSYTTAGLYRDTLVSRRGCLDSIVMTNLIVIRSVVTNQTVSICPGQSYLINAHSYTTAGVYADTIFVPGTCDSIVNTTIVILPTSASSLSVTICSNQTYLFNGVLINITGTYLDTFVNYVGCDSVESLILTVNLTSTGTINASICPGSTYLFNGVNRSVTGSYLDTFTNIIGCDSVVTLNLTLLATSTGSITTSICPGGSYLFNGINLTAAGIYLDTFANSVGCDSVVTLNLSMRATSAGSFTIRICPGGTYLFNGIIRTVAGAYLDTLVNSVGCDSVVTLNLIMLSTSTGSISASICSGTSYLFNGINRFTAGAYLDTFPNSVGCDSVVTLTLTIRATSTGSIIASICPGSTYLFNGINRTIAGAYLDTFPTYLGCDSIVTLTLSIRPTSSRSFSVNICPGSTYLYNGLNRSVTGAYLDTFTNYVGCDSVVTLNLFVYLPVTRTQNITICNPSTITVGSNTYSTSGTFRDTFVNYVSCDSVVITNLTVNYVVNVLLQPIICEGYSFRVGSSIYTTTNIYMDTLTSRVGCDSIIQTNLTVNPRTYGAQSFTLCLGQSVRVGLNVYNTDGLYTDTLINVYGCDSVLTTNVIVKRPVTFVIDTSICIGNIYDGVSYTTETHYSDTIDYSIGCDSFITQTNIFIIPDPALVISNDVALCAGISTTLNAFGGSSAYTWTPSSSLSCSNCSSPVATPFDNTLYTVTTYGCNGNLLTASVFVAVQPLPLINVLNIDTCVFYGQKIELISEYDINPTNHVNWYVTGVTVCKDCPIQIISPYLSGYYQAVVTDSVGCVGSDSFNLCVRTDCPDSTLIVPNFMTPNGDGVNDNFTILNPENIPIVFLRIFDRWGTMIYESYSQTPSWNGYYLGTVALPGVYVYYIESTCPITGNVIKAGNVTILD